MMNLIRTIQDMVRKETLQEEDEYKVKYENRRWLHRRRLAYMAFYVLALLTYLVLFGDISNERLDKLGEILIFAYITFGSIIGAYVGFSALERNKNG